MDKAIRKIGYDVPFDYEKHIVIFNKKAIELANEVHEETGLKNRYVEIESIEDLGGGIHINDLLESLYHRFCEHDVYVTICDNKNYSALIAKIETKDINGELHIYFADGKIVILFKTKIEMPWLESGWNSLEYKDFCREIGGFVDEFGIKRFRKNRCDYPVFYIINDDKGGVYIDKCFEIMLDVISALKDRYVLKEWDGEKKKLLIRTSR